MDQKRIRVVLFSTWGSDYKQVELGVSTFIGILAGVALIVMLLGASLLYGSRVAFQYFYTKMQVEQQSVLRNQFTQWQARTEELARRYERSQGQPGGRLLTLNGKEAAAENAESLNGRGGAFIDEDDNILPTLQAGSHLPNANLYSDHSQKRLHVDYAEVSDADLIGHLENRVSESRQAYEVIFEEFENRRRQLEHIPSIKPILSGRITDFFGKRVDPFVRKIRHHRGLDVAAPYGTEVYAPAAGTVELAKSSYRTKRGYGRVVIIDHGHGMKTLYGHLSKVLVKQGHKVQRWQVLGLVGDTGRATGPHLHYEVWVDGKARDPVEFIINE